MNKITFGDTVYNRVAVSEMSEAELEQWVLELRTRRLHMAEQLKIAREDSERLRHEKNKAAYDKQMKMVEKEAASVEKATIKLEGRIEKLIQLKRIDERED